MITTILRRLVAATGVSAIFPISSASMPLLGFPSSHLERTAENLTAAVDFLWPNERPWYAEYQKTAPCGTNASVSTRTNFPLDSGPISLTIAEDAYSMVFRIAYTDNPTSQSDFSTQILSTTQVAAGHRCYTAANSSSSITAGTNATIQMEYISHYNGTVMENYYACADITLVQDAAFTTEVNCFNYTVTSTSPDGILTTTPSSSSTSSGTSSSSGNGGGLSSGATAGVAVGCVVVGLAIIGTVALVLRMRMVRRRRSRVESLKARGEGLGGGNVELNDLRRS